MASAKDIILRPIDAKTARDLVKRVHYSGRVVNNSQLHIGVFLNGKLEGAMQFGPPMDKRKLLHLVADTPWNGMIELNRMAFTDALPRNSESRAIAIAMRLLRKHKPNLQWVVSFSDATACGDGTIYRASGFLLTGIRKNTQVYLSPCGTRTETKMTLTKDPAHMRDGKASMSALVAEGWTALPGFQLRYVYLLDPTARERLATPVLPFSEIARRGASMYRGQKPPTQQPPRAGSDPDDTTAYPAVEGGATPTPAL